MIEKRPEWANRIRKARESKKMSQRDMVKKLEIYQTTLVTYETGRREPRVGFLMGLMRETGVNGHWLLTGEGDMYGEDKKSITKEEAIEALFGDRTDEVLLYLIDAIKVPYLRSILFTKAIESKEQHKDLFDKKKGD